MLGFSTCVVSFKKCIFTESNTCVECDNTTPPWLLFTVTAYCVRDLICISEMPFSSLPLLPRLILPQLEQCRKCPIKLGAIFLNVEEVSILLLPPSLPPPPPHLLFTLLLFHNVLPTFPGLYELLKVFQEHAEPVEADGRGRHRVLCCKFPQLTPSLPCVFLVSTTHITSSSFLHCSGCTIQTARELQPGVLPYQALPEDHQIQAVP